MSKPKFDLDLDAVKELSLFVLNSLADQPKEWVAVGKAYQELHGFFEDPVFNKVFVRLFTVMREEMWVDSAKEGPKFTVGLTFKGQTVIRHPAEIDAIFRQHFRLLAKSIKAAERKQRHLNQQRAAKERKAQKILEKRKTKEARRDEELKRQAQAREKQAQTRQKREMSSLVASGKRIRSSLSKSNNEQLLNLWKANTSRAANSTGQKKHEHLLIVTAVEKEWRRRIRELPEVEAFKWPTTDAGSGHGGGDFERADESFLKVLGYTVGKTNGLPASTRQLILDRCFSGHLPPVEGILALRTWGEPNSALRLRKIAYHIAGLAKNFKKMQSRGYEDAISDWEDDLKYMHDKHYVRHFGFSWPVRGR
ncbi:MULTISPECIES: hypothetical protein [unclassified Ruegeria]|uniref:hypothetical protein n=1 Tax=unclassified Ruegeria TaxID=2625375 RepID=UPI0014893F75|nr:MULTISPECIES: hypothetical protein [unclassified Ruegeria]